MPAYGVIVPLGHAYSDGIVRGVLAAAAAEPGVIVRVYRPAVAVPEEVAAWAAWAAPDGIISTGVVVPGMRRVGLFDDAALRVVLDDAAIARLAAEQLIATHAGSLCALDGGAPWARSRSAAFVAACRAAGRAAVVVDAEGFDFPPGQARVVAALQGMTAPVGCFAGNDCTAAAISDACARAGLAVGRRVLMVGADDDDIACRSVHPHLSTVRIPWERVGAEALALLRGREREGERVVAPLDVVVRGSSDALASADPAIVAAVACARAGADGVVALAAAAGMSRRALERRCQEVLGLSPLQVIHAVRLARARDLLLGGMGIDAVAHACGWGSRHAFLSAFRLAVGETPSAWVAQRRGSPKSAAVARARGAARAPG